MNGFNDIYGNKFIKNSLLNSIKFNKVSHSYIFDGEAGVGKKMLADAFAKKLQCEADGEDGCLCISCRVFDLKNHPDIIYVSQDKKSSIGVDDIRDKINANINIKPYRYRYKVFIIDKADTMTISAQNALLKTIEEPPSYGVFILLSRNMSLFLPTILSRCVAFKIKPLTNEIIRAYLQNHDNKSEIESFLVAYSKGSIGNLIKIKEDSEFIELREKIITAICLAENDNIAKMIEISKQIEELKDFFLDVLDILYIWYRDVLIFKVSNRNDLIINLDKLLEIKLFSEKFNIDELLRAGRAILNAKIFTESNANFQMNFNNMLFNIISCFE